MAGEQLHAQHALQQAMSLHQQGDFAQAKQLYKQALKRNPKLTQAYNLLGVLMLQTGHTDLGIDHLKKAIKLNPQLDDAHVNLGNGYRLLGRAQDAIAAYSHALKINPANQDALNNRALTLQNMGRTQDALVDFKNLIQLNSSSAEFYFNLGTVLNETQSFEDAALAFELALELDENAPVVLNNYAHALDGLGRHDEALIAYDKALNFDPHYTLAHVNKGLTLMKRALYQEALACFERALVEQSDHHIAQFNKGLCLMKQGRNEDALNAWAFLENVEKSPDVALFMAQAHHALGHRSETETYISKAMTAQADEDVAQAALIKAQMAVMQGAWDDAKNACATAIKAKAPAAQITAIEAHMALVQADYATGWPLLARLHESTRSAASLFDVPHWQGEPLAGKTIYVAGTDDDGLIFLLCRLLAEIEKQGAQVYFAPPAHLAFVLKSLKGVAKYIKAGDDVSGCDYRIELTALPALMQLDEAHIPHETPYLSADSARVAAWRAKLGIEGCKIGVAWQADQGLTPSYSSLPRSALKSLAQMENVRLIGLHKAQDLTQAQDADHNNDVKIESCGALFDTGPDAYADAAAVMECCDLIISADHSLAHLAGALGRPIWLALPPVPHWPWQCARNDSVFYPTAAVFRQSKLDDWASSCDAIEQVLRSLLMPATA